MGLGARLPRERERARQRLYARLEPRGNGGWMAALPGDRSQIADLPPDGRRPESWPAAAREPTRPERVARRSRLRGTAADRGALVDVWTPSQRHTRRSGAPLSQR